MICRNKSKTKSFVANEMFALIRTDGRTDRQTYEQG